MGIVLSDSTSETYNHYYLNDMQMNKKRQHIPGDKFGVYAAFFLRIIAFRLFYCLVKIFHVYLPLIKNRHISNNFRDKLSVWGPNPYTYALYKSLKM